MIRRVFSAILLPVPATFLMSIGQVELGIAVTIAYASFESVFRFKWAATEVTRLKFAFIVDAILQVIIALLSAVFLALIAFPEQSKLIRLEFSGYQGAIDIVPSYLVILWSFSLATLPVMTAKSKDTRTWTYNRHTASALAAFGLVGITLALSTSRAEAFASRGEDSGNGLVAILYWSGVVFIAYVVVLWNKEHGLLSPIVAGIFLMGIITNGNRSPIAVIAVAILVRALLSNWHRILRFAPLAIPVVLLVFSYQAVWRSLVANGAPSSPSNVLDRISNDPLSAFLRLGFDTLDGHVLTTSLLQSGYVARPLDPLLAITNFIPRQIWSEKPNLLGSEIGNDYLGVTAGGIFLSGPGYFALVSGSIVLGAVLLVLLVLAIKQLMVSYSLHPVVVSALIYLCARISIAGDAFDIFLSLQMVVILAVCALIGRAVPRWL